MAGYLAANPSMATALQFMEGVVFSNRVLGFVNAPALMQRLVAKLQDESVDIADYQDKRDLLVNSLTGMGFNMVKPDGAFYLFPKSPLADDVEFVKLAQKHHILLVPGAGFGAPRSTVVMTSSKGPGCPVKLPGSFQLFKQQRCWRSINLLCYKH